MDRKRHQTCLHLKAVGKASPLLAEFAHPRTRHPFAHHDAYFSKLSKDYITWSFQIARASHLATSIKLEYSLFYFSRASYSIFFSSRGTAGAVFYQALGSLSTALRQSGFTIEYKETSQARKCLDAFAFRFYFVKSLLPFVNAAFILKSMLLYLFL